jgi:hypothetical protein
MLLVTPAPHGSRAWDARVGALECLRKNGAWLPRRRSFWPIGGTLRSHRLRAASSHLGRRRRYRERLSNAALRTRGPVRVITRGHAGGLETTIGAPSVLAPAVMGGRGPGCFTSGTMRVALPGRRPPTHPSSCPASPRDAASVLESIALGRPSCLLDSSVSLGKCRKPRDPPNIRAAPSDKGTGSEYHRRAEHESRLGNFRQFAYSHETTSQI